MVCEKDKTSSVDKIHNFSANCQNCLEIEEKEQTLQENIVDNYKSITKKLNDEIDIDIETLKEEYIKIFENYFIGITIADNNERIIYWNKYAEKLLNMDEKDLFLKDIIDKFH